MSKKSVPPPQSAPAWPAFAATGLAGVLVGATLMYFALRPAMQPAANGSMAAAARTDSTSHQPDPSLTAGQTPAQASRTLGNFHYDHDNWAQAISHYEAAIQQGLDDPDIRTDLGNAYRFSGRFDDALVQYRRAQEQDPLHEYSLFNQGGLYLEDLHQPAKAVEVWQQYLARFPNGRSVAAARQLLAQAQSGAASPVPPAAGGTNQSSAAEQIILKQINAAPAKTGQP
ncbi:MAG TPA: tetratricopeptide repeat protein [Lacunisphaera sp.]|nr:tetratricopeptide repeat protein [Lacunisphaera sp.]